MLTIWDKWDAQVIDIRHKTQDLQECAAIYQSLLGSYRTQNYSEYQNIRSLPLYAVASIFLDKQRAAFEYLYDRLGFNLKI